MLAPRPAGLTIVRVLAPALLVAVAVAVGTGHPSSIAAFGALAGTIVAAVLAADTEFAIASANAVAYGDERRYPLRVPPALFVGPLPVARVVVVAGVVVGPLLVAGGHYLAGGVAVVIGLPLAVLAGRALHRLSRRWLVLVPAGVVVVDRMSLVENTLFPREHIQLLRTLAGDESPGTALDLRMGATLGSLVAAFDEPAELVLAARPGQDARTVNAPGIAIAVARRAEVLAGSSAAKGARRGRQRGDTLTRRGLTMVLGGLRRDPSAEHPVALVQRDDLARARHEEPGVQPDVRAVESAR